MFVSVYPGDNANDVEINPRIEITFSKDLSKTKVNRNNIIVIDEAANRIINCSYSVSGPVVTLLPQRILETHTAYKIYLVGADDLTAPFPITFSDASTLVESLELMFKTGESYQDKDGRLASSENKDSVEDYPLILDGSVDLPGVQITTSSATELAIVGQYPMTGDVSVLVTHPEIRISFSHDLLGYGSPDSISILQSDLDKMLTISQTALLSKNFIFDPVSKTFYCPSDIGEPDDPKYLAPQGTVSVEGKDLVFTLNPGEMWKANTVITVTISPDIIGDVGGVPTAFHAVSTSYRFSTEIYPAFSSVNSVRFALGSMSQDVSDINIEAAILRSSVQAWHYARGNTSLFNPCYEAVLYSETSAVVSIMNMAEIGSDALRGKTMQLGDLAIRYQMSRNTDPTISNLRKALEDDLIILIRALAMKGGSSGGLSSSGRQFKNPTLETPFRPWEVNGKHKLSNTIEERSISASVKLPIAI